ncbi:MAG: YgiQ family radical SAM protein [Desulfobacteraceae bacterium 4572_35.1]|nr:MAG: YgiQ family radical SAM protein [Desulfobacteraceae bacterium 4572_35.1]
MLKTEDMTKFIPTTRAEMEARGWSELDVLFVSGDAYVDHPAFGVPLLARLLEYHGFRVGIIAQPDWRDPQALQVLGRPRLCAAISAGAMDSMVNHYTAARKKRRDDAYTPGGMSGARPNRAVIAYTAAVKGAFKGLPVIIGGIEASLRRLAHYDYWSDRVRRSVLVDSKADLLVYGMGEKPLIEIVSRLHQGEVVEQLTDIAGTAWLSTVAVAGEQLPSFEEVSEDTQSYAQMFLSVEQHKNSTLVQQHGKRFVVINRSAPSLTTVELDQLYGLPFCRRSHPNYTAKITAFEQIRWSVTSHRGCQGGCAFCAIARHQGRHVQSRSEQSIVKEIENMTHDNQFRGTISDVGGPTANMYGIELVQRERCQKCKRSSCIYPQVCSNLRVKPERGAKLLWQISNVDGVKHVFVASGVRYDLLEQQPEYLHQLLDHHVGGLLKVAPEALSAPLLKVMRKPMPDCFSRFIDTFRQHNRRSGKRRGIVPYLMAAHPGSTLSDMVDTALFLCQYGLQVEQVQEFTPTPGTLATCMYHTGIDPLTGTAVVSTYSEKERRLQKALLLYHQPQNKRDIREALRLCGREDAAEKLLGAHRVQRSEDKGNVVSEKGSHHRRGKGRRVVKRGRNK